MNQVTRGTGRLEDLIVYTALFGSYEPLNNCPITVNSDVRMVCFTDDESLTSSTWEIVKVRRRIAWDPTRTARELKILGHPAIREHALSLWIDNRIQLRRSPVEFFAYGLADADLALPVHSFRDTVRDEYAAVLYSDLDRPERVREQLFQMQRYFPSVLDERPYATGMLMRRHSDALQEVMQTWFAHVLWGSRRDQLSVNLALHGSPIKVNAMRLEIQSSEWHEWLDLPKDQDIVRSRGYRYGIAAHIRDRAAQSRWWRAVRRVSPRKKRG
jgi:hypothetical protein